MARRVTHEAAAPIKIDPAAWPRDDQGNLKTLSMCACGISSKFPFCDGSHKACAGEAPGRVYTYDPVTKQPIPQADPPAAG
jgi:CDGSH-type Zn-finger protein